MSILTRRKVKESRSKRTPPRAMSGSPHRCGRIRSALPVAEGESHSTSLSGFDATVIPGGATNVDDEQLTKVARVTEMKDELTTASIPQIASAHRQAEKVAAVRRQSLAYPVQLPAALAGVCAMFVVVSTVRAKSPEDARAICASFNVNLALAQTPGYLQGSCGIAVTDPCAVIGLQYWGTQSARDFELASENAQRTLAENAPRLAGPPASTVYEIL